MSEPVEITGVAWSGNLKEWATEKTQAEILDVLQDSMKLQKDQLDAMRKAMRCVCSGDSKGAKDSLDKVSRKIRDNNKPKKEEVKTIQAGTQARKKGITAMIASKGAFIAMTAATTLLVTAMAKMTQALFEQVNNYDKAIKSGLNFGNTIDGVDTGFKNMASLADEVNLRYSTLIGTMTKFNTAISRYGEKRFVKTISAMDEQLRGFGFTTAETAEFLGEYLNQQHRLGLNQLMTERQMNESATRAAKSIADWSQMLGKSREEIKKSIGDTLASADVEGFINDISDPALMQRVRDSFAQLGSSIDNPELRKMIERLATSDNPMADPAYQKLLQSGAHQLAGSVLNMANTIRDGNLDQQAAASAIRDMNAQVSGMDLTQLRSFYGEAGKDAQEWALSIKKSARDLNTERVAEEKAAMDARANFNSALERLRTFWQKIVGGLDGTDSILNSFTKTLENIIKFLDKNAGAISNVINGMIQAIMSGTEWLLNFLGDESNGKTMSERMSSLIKVAFSGLGDIAGEAILGAFTGLGKLVIEGWVKIGEWIYYTIKDGILSAMTWVGVGIKTLGGTIFESVANFIKSITSGVAGLAPNFLKKITSGFTTLVTKIPFIGPLISGTWDAVVDAMGQEGAWYKKLGAGLLGMAGGIVKSFTTLPTMIIDWVFGSDLTGFINDMITNIKDKIKSFFSGLFGGDDDSDEVKKQVDKERSAQQAKLASLEKALEENRARLEKEDPKKLAEIEAAIAKAKRPIDLETDKKVAQLDSMMSKNNSTMNLPNAEVNSVDRTTSDQVSPMVTEKERVVEQVAQAIEKETEKEDKTPAPALDTALSDPKIVESMSKEDVNRLLEKLIELNQQILMAINEGNKGQKGLKSAVKDINGTNF